MNIYNIGLCTHTNVMLGAIVIADHADAAYERASAYCQANGVVLQGGWLAQRRDTREDNNEWFDRVYPRRIVLL